MPVPSRRLRQRSAHHLDRAIAIAAPFAGQPDHPLVPAVGLPAFWEMLVFVGMLLIGYWYLLKRGAFRW